MNIGLIYIVVAQLLWSTEMILIRKFFPSVNPFYLSAIGSVIGSLFYLPTFLIIRQKFTVHNWLILFVYALTSWFLAQIFYVSGIQKGLNTFSVSLATLTLPVFSVILGMIFLKESLTVKTVIGGVLMVAGFLTISLK